MESSVNLQSPQITDEDVQAQLLVVEDEEDQQELLRCNLAREGFGVTCADDGEQALQCVQEQIPDLIVLDLMLPGLGGLEVCKVLRKNPRTMAVPIVMVTAKTEDTEMVTGLEVGADDYVTKPYSPRVLVARIKAVLRRRPRRSGPQPPTPDQDEVIRVRDLSIRPDRFEVMVSGKQVRLSGTEFRLLALLARHPGRVFTREQIIRSVHGDNCAVTDRSVDVHIFWLRQKLGARGRMIEAVRGVGYRFRD
jgi:two-component system phosphate regulon response regulator PhoB